MAPERLLSATLYPTLGTTLRRPQVVIALSGGELIYFEMSAAGQLIEMHKRDMPGDVACLDLLPVPEGRQRSRFLAVGSYDNTVKPNQQLFCNAADLYTTMALTYCSTVRLPTFG